MRADALPPELEKFWRTDDGLTAIQRAEACGIELSLLEDNLRLTPLERMRQNDALLNEVEIPRNALIETRARPHANHTQACGSQR